jgi:hypothetical protein
MSKTPAEQQTSALSDIRFWQVARLVVFVPWTVAVLLQFFIGGSWVGTSTSLGVVFLVVNSALTNARVKLCEANLRAVAELIGRQSGAIR